MRIEGPDTT